MKSVGISGCSRWLYYNTAKISVGDYIPETPINARVRASREYRLTTRERVKGNWCFRSLRIAPAAGRGVYV